MEENTRKSQIYPKYLKPLFFSVAGIALLGGALYAAFVYSQKQSNNIILPGGTTYLGEKKATPEVSKLNPPPNVQLKFTAENDVSWNLKTGKIYPYAFSYPSTLNLVIFPEDPIDSVAIDWNKINPQENILINVELPGERDPKYVGSKLEYVRNWYKYFTGLKGVEKVETFTNTSGLKGYKAYYINTANTVPNVDVFLEVPEKPEIMIHLANGVLDPKIFDRIVDSVKWNAPTQTPKKSPAPTK